MLGSLHDAEDAVRDTFLRAWRGLGGFRGHSAIRTLLYRIATNACLDLIAGRPNGRALPIDFGSPSPSRADVGQPLVESAWVEPYPDEALRVVDGYAAPEARYEQREAVELAFIVALQHVFSMPPWSSWWRGREMIAGFAADEACAEARMVATRASGQPALASYAFEAKTGRFVAAAIDVLTLEGALIGEMTAFVSPEMFPRFNLPQGLAA